jgi:CheY-like chemotaxis protein
VAAIAEDVAILVFEAIRELLINVSEHARVTQATVSLRWEEHHLTAVVSDAGAGFDPDAAVSSAPSGGQFGLFSIRERLKALGGSLDIAAAPACGTVVTLTVPLQPVEDKPSPISPDGGRPAAPAAPSNSTAEWRVPEGKIRVLLADDQAAVRLMLRRTLGLNADFELVGEAPDGSAAITLTRASLPNVILMDVNMPGVDGIEATRRIKAEFPDIQIIGFSGIQDDNISDNMLQAGAAAHLSKTSTIDELCRVIRAVWSSECNREPHTAQ